MSANKATATTSSPNDSSRKRAALVYCHTCKKSTDSKNTILCASCKNFFEYDCAGYSEKLFLIMKEDSKKKWKCKTCKQLKKLPKSSKTVTYNGTLRKKRSCTTTTNIESSSLQKPCTQSSTGNNLESASTISPQQKTPESPLSSTLVENNEDNGTLIRPKYNVSVSNSFEYLSEEDYQGNESLPGHSQINRSCPQITNDPREEIETLKNKLIDTQTQLMTAENEIEILTSENFQLKKEINSYKIKNNALTHLCKTIPIHERSSSSSKKNRHSICHFSGELDKTASKNLSTPLKECANTGTINSLLKEIDNLNSQLVKSHEDIIQLESRIQELEIINQRINGERTENSLEILPSEHTTQESKREICIISANNSNKVLSLSQQVLTEHNICHYLTPNVGLRQLLIGLHSKLSNFTHKDFCIILIGEEDFKRTDDYLDLISFVRETLINIVHTNILLCLPTFRFGKQFNMFNFRIESFNNLLYLDNLQHQYANLVDSNLDWQYDLTMIQQTTGKINNRGMQKIFDTIKAILNTFDQSNILTRKKQFFR